VTVLPQEINSFFNGLMQINWRKLTDHYPKYDQTIVLEFYTNVWTEGSNDLKVKVQGR